VVDVGDVRRGGVQQAVEGVLGRPGGRGGQAAADLGPRPRPGDGRTTPSRR